MAATGADRDIGKDLMSAEALPARAKRSCNTKVICILSGHGIARECCVLLLVKMCSPLPKEK